MANFVGTQLSEGVLPSNNANANIDLSGFQYNRKYSLVVYQTQPTFAANGALASPTQNNGNALDLSQLHFKFACKRTSAQTINSGDIRIYNPAPTTVVSLLALAPTRGAQGTLITSGGVVLQAGYPSNYGTIFQGNIKQVIVGRESATDTFVDLVVGDGDLGYNFAVVNKTIAAGSRQQDQISVAAQALANYGVNFGTGGKLPLSQLPRAKVLFGNARNYLRQVAQNTNQQWSIQNGQIEFVPLKSYAPGEAVILTSKTGLIGTPQQTNSGINVKCLLNPKIRVSGLIDISQATVQNLKIDLQNPSDPVNDAPPLNQDGIYYVLAMEHRGDTRGIEWYTSLICLTVDATSNSVQPGFGQ